jgi:hypothetical protein
MAGEVIEQQLADPRRLLIGGVVADARQGRETVIRLDEFGRAFRGYAADRVIGLAPDEQGRHAGGPTIGARSPRARYQASAASMAGGLPITNKCFSMASRGTPLRAKRSRTHFPFSASSFCPASGSSNSW